MATVEWSLPVLILTQNPFAMFSFHPSEEGRDRAVLVNTYANQVNLQPDQNDLNIL